MSALWVIGGTSTDGAAGLATDLAVARALGVAPRLMVTAITAQDENEVSAIELSASLAEQAAVLRRGPRARAIKTGMLGGAAAVREVLALVGESDLICDPVLAAGSGGSLLDGEGRRALLALIAKARLITPNWEEAEALVGHSIEDVAAAAREILTLGAREVLIKGGHRLADFCDDYWTDGERAMVLRSPRRSVSGTHGTGCTLASAIATGIAQGMDSPSAITRAKALVNRGLRLRPVPLAMPEWPYEASAEDLPWVPAGDLCFPDCGGPLGFYPIVDRAEWLARLLPQGVTTVQLRVKDLRGAQLRREIARAVRLSRERGARLFVNDYWELAIAEGAYGVHLGQEDLEHADLPKIAKANLRLGISTHNYVEVARAHGLRPSYLAVGPIFPTTLKAMPYPPQGLRALAAWKNLVPYPLVAIGGMKLEHASEAIANGASAIAVVSDLTRNRNPEARAREWVSAVAK